MKRRRSPAVAFLPTPAEQAARVRLRTFRARHMDIMTQLMVARAHYRADMDSGFLETVYLQKGGSHERDRKNRNVER